MDPDRRRRPRPRRCGGEVGAPGARPHRGGRDAHLGAGRSAGAVGPLAVGSRPAHRGRGPDLRARTDPRGVGRALARGRRQRPRAAARPPPPAAHPPGVGRARLAGGRDVGLARHRTARRGPRGARRDRPGRRPCDHGRVPRAGCPRPSSRRARGTSATSRPATPTSSPVSPTSPPPTDVETLAAQVRLVDAWRRFPFLDPGLPDDPAARRLGGPPRRRGVPRQARRVGPRRDARRRGPRPGRPSPATGSRSSSR